MKNLRLLRKKQRLSQQELAQKLMISQQMVCRYENEDSAASEDVIIRTAQLFGVSIDYLLGICDEEQTDRILTQEDERNLLKENSTKYHTKTGYSLNEFQHMALYRQLSKQEQNALDILLERLCKI